MSRATDHPSPKPPSADRLSQLWRRINDHKMVQWSVAYVALAYGVQHGVTLTSEAFEWPPAVDWFAQNYSPARKTERFKTYVRTAGLVDYWRAKG